MWGGGGNENASNLTFPCFGNFFFSFDFWNAFRLLLTQGRLWNERIFLSAIRFSFESCGKSFQPELDSHVCTDTPSALALLNAENQFLLTFIYVSSKILGGNRLHYRKFWNKLGHFFISIVKMFVRLFRFLSDICLASG